MRTATIVGALLAGIFLSAASAQGSATAAGDTDPEARLKQMRRDGYSSLYAQKLPDAERHFNAMLTEFPERWEGYYDMACFNLRQKNVEQALDWLTRAVEHGCDDQKFFATDSDLKPIREAHAEAYAQLLARVGEHGQKRMRAEIAARAKQLAHRLPAQALFPFDFELSQHLGSGKARLGDFAGKVVILDIWGTWCPPCRMSIPHLIELGNRYRDVGLQVVGVNFERGLDGSYLDYEGAKTKVAEGAKSLGINYPLLHGEESFIAKVPGFRGFPTVLFIDATGQVRQVEVGYHSLEQMEPIVLTLLAEKLEAEEQAAAARAPETQAPPEESAPESQEPK